MTKAMWQPRNRLYGAWAIVSSGGLAVTAHVDPYVFAGLVGLATVVSGVFVCEALARSRRSLPWVLLSAVPTAVAFARLLRFRWA